MFSRTTLVGTVGADPEVRTTQDGRTIVNLNIATTESYKDKKTGERKTITEWHKVVIFNDNISKIVAQYIKKGAVITVEGQNKTRKWTDKNGVDKYTTEVVVPQFGGSLSFVSGGKSSGGGNAQKKPAPKSDWSVPDNGLDDEVPF